MLLYMQYMFFCFCSVLHRGGQTTWADTWTQILHPQSCVSILPRSRCSSPGEAPAMSPSCLHTLSFCPEALVSRAATPLLTSQTSCQIQLLFSEIETVALLHKPDLGSSLETQNIWALSAKANGKGLRGLVKKSNSTAAMKCLQCLNLIGREHDFFSFWPLPHVEDCTLHGHLLKKKKKCNLFIHWFSSFLMGILFIDSKVF